MSDCDHPGKKCEDSRTCPCLCAYCIISYTSWMNPSDDDDK